MSKLKSNPIPDGSPPETCRYQIMTNNSLHEAMWCANSYPCDRHGKWKEEEYIQQHGGANHLAYPTPSNPEEKLREWEKRFDEEFNFFKDMTVTPNQAGDFAQAELLQSYYRSCGENIKSFIDSLLSSQRTEILKKVGEKRDSTPCHHDQDGACYVKYGDVCTESYNRALDDIKSIIEKGI